ncbi:MAG: MGMT family protein [Crenarchaeota archaeon]|nr:MGMT family protein [Thermoproteota archaeon]
MKYVAYVPLYDIGLLRLDIGQGLKLLSSSIVDGSLPLEQSSPSSTDRVLELISLVRDILYGKEDSIKILPHIILPDGLKGLILLATLSIPRGKVASYSQIAQIIGTSPRVVGRVLALNPYPVIIPCHRVVRSSGELGGYSSSKIDVKMKILEREGVRISDGKVRKSDFISTDQLRERFARILQEYRKLRDNANI